MVKSTRKFAALFLTLALSFSFSIPTLAAETHDHDCETDVVCDGNTIGESVSPLFICTNHVWDYMSTLVPYTGLYISEYSCQANWKDTKKCSNCGKKETVGSHGVVGSHYTTLYSATCNGTTQTWQNRCYYCGHSMPTTTKRCPGGPHSGVCGYLPL